ncbi:MAG TPA: zinc ABC transporter substrate-binding protein, partial [Microbacterium sp.]|nr:zinc ABC transporter substrate-binding protein [Microbacterium sp.]
MIPRILAPVVVLAASALALAGCAASASPAASDGKIAVVASTNVYGDIAAAIGGDLVDVTSIIDSVAQDPHSYEASARDQLTVSRADLIIENGGGYDAFMDTLIEGAG